MNDNKLTTRPTTPNNEASSSSVAPYALGAIMAFRMLGLFMILPIFSVAAQHLSFATPRLIGLALGIYGLTQAICQLPLGALSDRYGRKPIIAFGLLLFAAGSILAAYSTSIYGVIIGRALQGMGAIGSTALALVADLTPEPRRLRAMAIVGLLIGAAFSIAMILGPLLNAHFGLNGIFWATAMLALLGILLLTALPRELSGPTRPTITPRHFSPLLQQPELLRVNLGIFILHAILTALFIAIPILLLQHFKWTETTQALFYLGVLGLAFILMLPGIIIAEKKQLFKAIFITAVGLLCLTQWLLLFLNQQILSVTLLLLLFFAAFNLLEACLPSLIAKIAHSTYKGTAMGLYSTAQFLGIFVGGTIGGILYHHFHITGILVFNSLLAVIWLIIASTMQNPQKQLSLMS